MKMKLLLLRTEDKTVSVYGGAAVSDQDDTDMSGYTFKHSSDFVEIEAKPLEKRKGGHCLSGTAQSCFLLCAYYLL